MSKPIAPRPREPFIGSVPVSFGQDDFVEKFHCDFDLDLSTLSDEELNVHNKLAEYSAAAINANLHAVDIRELDPTARKRVDKMLHAKSVYNAYRSKLNVETALRKSMRPHGKTLAEHFMIAAKITLPPELYQEILRSATEYYTR
jgi:hypothetical protein